MRSRAVGSFGRPRRYPESRLRRCSGSSARIRSFHDSRPTRFQEHSADYSCAPDLLFGEISVLQPFLLPALSKVALPNTCPYAIRHQASYQPDRDILPIEGARRPFPTRRRATKKTGSIVVRIKIVRIFALTKLLNKFVNSKRRPFQARGRAARRTGIRRAFRDKRTIFKRRERNGKDNPEQGTGYSAGSRT